MSEYEPSGIRFYDRASEREMCLVESGAYKDWLCYRHPDGQWVTLRKATDDDYQRLRREFGFLPAVERQSD